MEERKITDIHAHILPGVDDGSDSIGTTVEMLRLAYCQGIRRVIATPHGSPGFPYTSPSRLRELCAMVQAEASQIGEGIEILLGQEIYYTKESVERLEAGKLLTLAGTAYVLVEFPYEIPYRELYGAVRELVWARYRPVLAHIERYSCLRKEGRLKELSETGAYLQVNFQSIGASWLNETERWCRRQLKEGRIDFLGSDMHNMSRRRPELSRALEWMQGHLEEEYIRKLLSENAEQLLQGGQIGQRRERRGE